MLTIWQFPRDRNGIIQGSWRMLHRNREYTGQLGALDFVGGVAQRGLEAVELNRYVINLGKYLEAAEPWGGGPRIGSDEPSLDEVMSGKSIAHIMGDDLPAAESEESDRTTGFSPTPEDEYDVLAKADLLDLAEAKGLDPDRRWGAPRLREFLREAEHAGC